METGGEKATIAEDSVGLKVVPPSPSPPGGVAPLPQKAAVAEGTGDLKVVLPPPSPPGGVAPLPPPLVLHSPIPEYRVSRASSVVSSEESPTRSQSFDCPDFQHLNLCRKKTDSVRAEARRARRASEKCTEDSRSLRKRSLFEKCWQGDVEAAMCDYRVIVAETNDPLVVDDNGNTPVHVAAKMGNLPLVLQLLGQSSAPSPSAGGPNSPTRTHANRRIEGGTGPLEATTPSDTLSHSISATNSSSSSLSSSSTGVSYSERGRVLVDSANVLNVTPLGYAVLAEQPHVVEYLLRRGADINHQDDVNGSALHAVSRSPSPAMISLLLQRGAEADIVDFMGRTPLHLACAAADKSAVAALLGAGANPEVVDSRGRKPVDMLSLSWDSIPAKDKVRSMLARAGKQQQLVIQQQRQAQQQHLVATQQQQARQRQRNTSIPPPPLARQQQQQQQQQVVAHPTDDDDECKSMAPGGRTYSDMTTESPSAGMPKLEVLRPEIF